jgi:hypothetical protein
MRIRKGFVSNSSTTSFCIYGIYREEREEFDPVGKLKEMQKRDSELYYICTKAYRDKMDKNFEDLVKRRPDVAEDDYWKNQKKRGFVIQNIVDASEEDCKELLGRFYDQYEFLDFIGEVFDLEANYPPYGGVYIGKPWSSMSDDETGKEFKACTERLLQILFGPDIQCATHEEAWRDG